MPRLHSDDSSQAYQQQKETDANVVSLFKKMADLYSFVDDLKDLGNKIARLERTIVRVLVQTTECGIFIREYTKHGFIRKCDLCMVYSYAHGHLAARLLGQAISGRSQVVSDLSSALENLQNELNSGVAAHTALVSGQIREGVDKLSKYDQNPRKAQWVTNTISSS